MAESLRDQLLKSGLVQKLKTEARDARPPERIPRPANNQRPASRKPMPASTQAPRNPGPRNQEEMDLARAYGLRERAEREQRELEKKQAEQRTREKSERKQKLAALLSGKAQNKPDAEIARHFTHGEKIRRVYCTAEQLAQVNTGQLAVVQHLGHYLLVSREIGEQVRDISAAALTLLCDPDTAGEDDIPADLIW